MFTSTTAKAARFGAVLLTALMMVSTSIANPVANGSGVKAGKADSLVGSWFIEVTPNDAVPPPFKMLMTFGSDGTLLQTQNDALAPPFFATPGHGAWSRAGKDTYTLTMLQLTFDSAGTYTGKLKSRATVTVDEAGSGLSMVIRVEVTAPDGSEIFSTGGTAVGTRITPEPIN